MVLAVLVLVLDLVELVSQVLMPLSLLELPPLAVEGHLEQPVEHDHHYLPKLKKVQLLIMTIVK